MNLGWGCGDTKGKPVNCDAGFAPAAEELLIYRHLGQPLCEAVPPTPPPPSLSTSIPGDQAFRGLEGPGLSESLDDACASREVH